jgi:hypothetical protein
LWQHDRTLSNALELAKAILVPLDVLNVLWPCPGEFGALHIPFLQILIDNRKGSGVLVLEFVDHLESLRLSHLEQRWAPGSESEHLSFSRRLLFLLPLIYLTVLHFGILSCQVPTVR